MEQLTAVLRAQEARLSRQEEFQTAMASQMGLLSTQFQGLHDHLVRTTTAPEPLVVADATPLVPVLTGPAVGAGCKLAPPARFAGELGLCKTFLIDCSIHYELNPHAFPSNRSKIAFMISHLTGRAKAWASAEWARDSPVCHSLTEFEAALRKTFDPVTTDRERAGELSGLRQGSESVCDYAIRFRTLSAESGWNATALYDVFLKGESEPPEFLHTFFVRPIV